MKQLVWLADGLSELAGKISAWALFVIGFCICYEVFARYLFNAPTIWVSEVTMQLQIWAVFLTAGYVLKHREMIRIEIILKDHTSVWRKLAETFSIFMIFVFATPAIYYGFEIWMRAVKSGHTTDSFLAIPKWVTEGAVWIGFTILAIQALAELWRIWTVGIPAASDDPLEGAH